MNYFNLYGIPETLRSDAAMLRKKWGEVSRVYHPDRYANATAAERAEALQKTSLNNDAYRTLKDEDATLAYILKLNGALADDEKYALPPVFLMEMMELNEAIDSYEEVQTGEVKDSAYGSMTDALSEWEANMEPLINQFENGARDSRLFAALKDAYFRKKYLLRLKERLA